jgi:hypothetical protein
MILVRTDHPCLIVGCHTLSLSFNIGYVNILTAIANKQKRSIDSIRITMKAALHFTRAN